MKLQDLKIGATIKHYCTGEIVTGTVIEKGVDSVTTKHEATTWGNDIHTETIIHKSLPWQYNRSQTTPKAWFNNEVLKA